MVPKMFRPSFLHSFPKSETTRFVGELSLNLFLSEAFSRCHKTKSQMLWSTVRRSAMETLHLLEAHEIVGMLKAGSVTPLQLIDVVEERIRTTEPLVHATPIPCFERAREKARQLERSDARSRGFLYGLPVLIKDWMIVIWLESHTF